jgi:CRP-like cAMP-binding protein
LPVRGCGPGDAGNTLGLGDFGSVELVPSAEAVLQPIERLFVHLETIAELSDLDKAALAALPMRFADITPGSDIVREGDRPSECCLLVRGLACRYKMASKGRRQIVSLHFSGEVPDFQSLYLEKMDHTLSAMTRMRLAYIPHEALRPLLAARPGVAAALTRHAMVEASIFREWILNVGGRAGVERVAHLICEVFVRMRALGLAEGASLDLPMTQAQIAEITGMSPVHVNRVLQQLRGLKLLSSKGRTHFIEDWRGLRKIADFDPSYLHMRRHAVNDDLLGTAPNTNKKGRP